MEKETKYYSIRTVVAAGKVEAGEFDEEDIICDIIVTAEEAATIFNSRSN